MHFVKSGKDFYFGFFFLNIQYHTICKQTVTHTQRMICLKAYCGEDGSKEMTGTMMMMTACLEVEDQQIVLTYFYFSFVSPSDVLMDSFPPEASADVRGQEDDDVAAGVLTRLSKVTLGNEQLPVCK